MQFTVKLHLWLIVEILKSAVLTPIFAKDKPYDIFFCLLLCDMPTENEALQGLNAMSRDGNTNP